MRALPLLVAAALVAPASSQQAPGSTVVVPALATFTDPADASDVVGLLQVRAHAYVEVPL
jgi:hypothetical protein